MRSAKLNSPDTRGCKHIPFEAIWFSSDASSETGRNDMFLHVVCWNVSCIHTRAKLAILTPQARKKQDLPGAVLKASLRERNH